MLLMYINTCFGEKANRLLLKQYGEKTVCRLYNVKFFHNISSSAQIKKKQLKQNWKVVSLCNRH